jgi:hypothetical protein
MAVRITGLMICLFLFGGCAGVKEGARGFAGISTKVLEDSRPSALSKTIPAGFEECFARTEGFLSAAGCYLYAKDKNKGLLAVYVSETDTTPVGCFLSGAEAGTTRLEVSSAGTAAREFVAGKVFAAWDKELKARKVDVQLNAVEQNESGKTE